MPRALASALLLFAVSALAARYDVERPISTVRRGPTSPWQSSLNAATDGDTFLAIWNDGRAGFPANSFVSPYVAMAQRIDAQGRVLATTALPFSVLYGYFQPSVVWNGRWYVVVYRDQYVRISRDGVLLDAAAQTFPVSHVAAIAARGSQILAVSFANPAYPAHTSALVATLFDDELRPLTTTPIDSAASVYANVGVAASRSGFALFYLTDIFDSAPPRVEAVLLDAGANLVRGSFAVLQAGCAGGRDLHAASDGTNYFVATTTCAIFQYSSSDYFATAGITPAGTPLTASNNAVARFVDNHGYDPDAWSLAAVPGGYAIACLQLDTAGHPRAAVIPIDTYGDMSNAVLADTGVWPHHFGIAANAKGETMLLWGSGAGNDELANGEVFATTADFTARRVASFRLADGPFTQEGISAAVARDGTALVTWRERRGPTGPLALYAARIAADGTVLDPDSIPLSAATSDGTRAAVVSDGHDFLVAWSEPGAISFRRVGSDGRALDTTSLRGSFLLPDTTSASSLSPALAWNGSEYLLAWNDREVGPMGTTTSVTQAMRISAAGAQLEQPHAINQAAPASAGVPVAASNGDDFLVAYTQVVAGSNATAVARISAAGTVMANVPIVLSYTSALFWNGKSYAALELGLGGSYGVRISADALPLDGVPGGKPESSGPPIPGHWSDIVQPQCDANGCYAAQLTLTTAGALQIETWRVTDANGAFDRTVPAVVATVPAMFWIGSAAIVLPGSAPRLVYSRNTVEPQYLGVNRVFVRTQAPHQRASKH